MQNEFEVEGGVVQWDNGTIRYIDNYGNTKSIWHEDDEHYSFWKELYFPNVHNLPGS